MRNYSGFTVILALLFALTGCATPDRPAPADSPVRIIAGVQAALPVDDRVAPESESVPLSLPIKPSPPEIPDEPDAIITFDPGLWRLSDSAEKQLARIAGQAKTGKRSLVWLYSYVPEGGSNALSIGLGERPLKIVRDHLQGLGVSPRKILLANFGQEYEKPHRPASPWVEIYLVNE